MENIAAPRVDGYVCSIYCSRQPCHTAPAHFAPLNIPSSAVVKADGYTIANESTDFLMIHIKTCQTLRGK